jgi:hypothetical protein
MKKFIIFYLLTLFLIPSLIIGAVSASDISGAQYSGVITVTNNSTASTLVSANISGLSSSNLTAQDWLNSSANNCAIQYSGSDVAFMPGYGTNPWCMFVNSIGANSQLNYNFLTHDVTGGKLAYFPGASGMSVNDTAPLELSNNFSISMTAFLKAGGDIFIKASAISCNFSLSNNLTAAILTGYKSPTGFVDPSGLWINETRTYDGNTANYAETSNYYPGNTWSDFIELSISPLWVDSVKIWTIKDGNHTEIDIDTYYNSAWHDVYEGTDFNNGDWTEKSLTSPQICSAMRFRQKVVNGYPRLYEASFYSTVQVSSIITEGEKTVTVYADSTNFKMDINGVNVSSTLLSGASVIDNSNNWQIGSEDGTPYITSANITVAGVLRGSWAWQYGATFTDLSGNGNTATPSFRTTSSDADVSAALTSFAPITEPEAPPFVIGAGPDWFTGNITISGNYTTGNNTLNYPGRAFIESLSSATATPSQFPVTFISGFVILALSITTSAFLRQNGSASLFVKITILFACFGFAAGVRAYDWWMIIFLGIFSLFVMYASKERTS